VPLSLTIACHDIEPIESFLIVAITLTQCERIVTILREIRVCGLECFDTASYSKPVTPSFGNWYSIQLSYRRIYDCIDAKPSLDQLIVILFLVCDC
jgi:hypothetical protein